MEDEPNVFFNSASLTGGKSQADGYFTRGFAGLKVLLTASAAPVARLATRLRMPSDFCWVARDSSRPVGRELVT
jgi:hypothetical protein